MREPEHSQQTSEPAEGPWPRRLKWLGREILVNGAIIGLVVLGMMAYQRDVQSGGGGKLTVGEAPPDFTLMSMDSGREVSLKDLSDRPTIINFWATWCGPCIRELPIIQAQCVRQGSFFCFNIFC